MSYEQLDFFDQIMPDAGQGQTETAPRPSGRVHMHTHCGRQPEIRISLGRDIFAYNYSVRCVICGYSTGHYATAKNAIDSWELHSDS